MGTVVSRANVPVAAAEVQSKSQVSIQVTRSETIKHASCKWWWMMVEAACEPTCMLCTWYYKHYCCFATSAGGV
jgi:hypothetical protein